MLQTKEEKQAQDALFRDLTYRLEAIELKTGKVERESASTADDLKRAQQDFVTKEDLRKLRRDVEEQARLQEEKLEELENMVDEMKVNHESRLGHVENKVKEMEKAVSAIYPILMEMPPPADNRHKRSFAPGFAESTQYSTAEEGKGGHERHLSPAAENVQLVSRLPGRGQMRSGCPSTEFETLAQSSARGVLDESGAGRDRSTLEPVEGVRHGAKEYMRVEESYPLGGREEEKVQVMKSQKIFSEQQARTIAEEQRPSFGSATKKGRPTQPSQLIATPGSKESPMQRVSDVSAGPVH